MKVSDKINAEFINMSVFRVTDRIHKDKVFYKSGLIILSETNPEVTKMLKNIDIIAGIIDSYVIRDDMKKALLYTALLRKRVSKFIKVVNDTEVPLSSVN